MKNYSRLIGASLCFYGIIAITTYVVLSWNEQQERQLHKVEINRIYQEIAHTNNIEVVLNKPYDYIDEILYLSATEANEDIIDAFYADYNDTSSSIKVLYDERGIKGYIKFIYPIATIEIQRIILWCQGALFLLEVGMLWLLWYLKKHLVTPFQQVSSLPLELAKGHFKGDIKEEKSKYLGQFLWGMGQLQDHLHVSQKRQLELEKEKKQLLLSLSHDIKTPLNLIKLYGKAIEDHVYTSEVEIQQAAHQIQVKTLDIDHYVESIMKTSREDILDIQVKQEEVYLRDIVEKLKTTIQHTCHLRGIELCVAPYENRLLKGDIDRLQEVVENLFDNACKYGDGKRIEISFYEEDYCQLIRFFNTGICVSNQDRNHIFESFFRGANSEGKQGNGLGLYICREIMRKMDGEIFVQPETTGMAFILVVR